MAINIDEIIDEHGEYYRKGGQGEKNLVKKFYQKSETEELFSRVITQSTTYDTAAIETGRVLQPYQDAFTPLGSMDFVPEKIELFEQKIDTKENPSKIQKSWLGFLSDDDTRDRAEWPILRYWKEYLLNQKKEDQEKNEIYTGVHADPTPGTPGASGTAMNGLNKIFVDSLARSGTNKVQLITTGAWEADDADFVTQIEEWAESIPEDHLEMMGPLVMSKSLVRRVVRGNRKKYNISWDQKQDLTTIQDVELPVVGVASMKNKNRIWTTPKSNAIVCIKAPSGEEMLQLEKEDRSIKVWTDWWKGVGFRYHKLVYINDLT